MYTGNIGSSARVKRVLSRVFKPSSQFGIPKTFDILSFISLRPPLPTTVLKTILLNSKCKYVRMKRKEEFQESKEMVWKRSTVQFYQQQMALFRGTMHTY